MIEATNVPICGICSVCHKAIPLNTAVIYFPETREIQHPYDCRGEVTAYGSIANPGPRSIP